MTQVIVLGWDGLDHDLMEKHGVAQAFGSYHSKIDTFVNDVIGEPHTRELWPTLITGLKPPEHGIRAATPSEGVDWNNPIISAAATLANGIVPRHVLTELGRLVRQAGAGLDRKHAADYTVDTVFSEEDRPISIPNHHTSYDDTHGMDANRDQLWQELDVDRTVSDGIEPQVDLQTVQDVLGEAVGRRTTHTLGAMQSGKGLVWTWFGYLDSVGHINPALEYPLEREAYQLAASVTQTVRRMAGDDTIVITVSDHGLQDGGHTDYATIASDTKAIVDDVSAVWDLADVIRDINPARRVVGGDATATPGDVTQQLEALGYV